MAVEAGYDFVLAIGGGLKIYVDCWLGGAEGSLQNSYELAWLYILLWYI